MQTGIFQTAIPFIQMWKTRQGMKYLQGRFLELAS